ncbi:MAG TPA: hypothetical protein VKU02_11740 [Gemmataceae bacterium]|nr:hypothetical protein [Gemmataceae bacterium]
MPLLDFRQARADIRLADVLELLGWTARVRVGVQVRGPCPVPGSRSPRSRSFAAHLGKNCWQCFRGGAAGSPGPVGPGDPAERVCGGAGLVSPARPVGAAATGDPPALNFGTITDPDEDMERQEHDERSMTEPERACRGAERPN